MNRENVYKLSETDKLVLTGKLRHNLEKHDEISFAYIHGSYVSKDEFRDIDVAVYLEKLPESFLEYELQIEAELIGVCGVIVDVRILNNSPVSFRYNVIKNGFPIFIRDDDKRSDFQEATLASYFDFAPYRSRYLKEALGIGIQS